MRERVRSQTSIKHIECPLVIYLFISLISLNMNLVIAHLNNEILFIESFSISVWSSEILRSDHQDRFLELNANRLHAIRTFIINSKPVRNNMNLQNVHGTYIKLYGPPKLQFSGAQYE